MEERELLYYHEDYDYDSYSSRWTAASESFKASKIAMPPTGGGIGRGRILRDPRPSLVPGSSETELPPVPPPPPPVEETGDVLNGTLSPPPVEDEEAREAEQLNAFLDITGEKDDDEVSRPPPPPVDDEEARELEQLDAFLGVPGKKGDDKGSPRPRPPVDDKEARELEQLNAFLGRRGGSKGSRPSERWSMNNVKVQPWEEQGWDYPLQNNKPVVVLEPSFSHKEGGLINVHCYSSHFSGVCVGGSTEECTICYNISHGRQEGDHKYSGREEPPHQSDISEERRLDSSSYIDGHLPTTPKNCNQEVNSKQKRRKPRHKREEQSTKAKGIFAPAKKPSFQEELEKSEQLSNVQNKSSIPTRIVPSDTSSSSFENGITLAGDKFSNRNNRSAGRTLNNNEEKPKRSVTCSYGPDLVASKFTDLFSCMQVRKYAAGIDVHRSFPIGIPVKARVVAILEPSCVFVQGKCEENELNRMCVEVAREQPRKLDRLEIQTNHYVAVLEKEYFYRGQVEAVESKTEFCRVRLVDKGYTVICSFNDIYSLPSKFLQFERLILPLNFIDITLAKDKDIIDPVTTKSWCVSSWLKYRLLNEEVFVTITHKLGCAPGVLYYGLIKFPETGVSVSDLLIEHELAVKDEKAHDGVAISAVKPQFSAFNIPLLNTGNKFEAKILHINQLDDFYVLPNGFAEKVTEVESGLNACMAHGLLLKLVAYGAHSGDKMCMAPHPTDPHSRARAFCEEIDYTQDPPIASIYYIDFGLRSKIDLSNIHEYHKILEKHPPLAYRCQIKAKPKGGVWQDEWQNYLQNAVDRGQHFPVRVTCTKEGSDRSVVSLRVFGAGQSWENALVELGGAVDESKSNENEPKFQMPYTSKFDEFIKPLEIIPEGDTVPSKYHFRNEPAPPLQDNDLLKTSRLSGYYLYVVMTEEAYKSYTKLREYIGTYVKTAQTGDYQYLVGDMALVPWGGQKYQRCYITGFESQNGIRVANVCAFDIERELQCSVARLKPVDDYILSIGRLSHVVWLEGTDEETTTYFSDFSKILNLWNGWTTLKRYKMNQEKYVVRLAIGKSEIESVLLADLIRRGNRWTWEKYYDIGLYQMSSLCKKSMEVTVVPPNFQEFFSSCEIYWSEMIALCRIQIRRIKLDDSGKKVLIQAIPCIDPVTRDYELLQEKLKRFYELAQLDKGPSGSPIYPTMVAYRCMNESSVAGKIPSRCTWHRGMYRDALKGYQCIDCFHAVKVDKNCDYEEVHKSQGLDIRELCPEFLKIPPIGQRFTCELPVSHENPMIKQLIEEVLSSGSMIEASLTKKTKLEWSESGKMVAPVSINVLELSRRLKAILEKLVKSKDPKA